eukprot:NODE_24_length_36516_cov_0.652470.p19 type:complete len:124 gc:universal NODE_24_length_36516_cov_0.652470:17342-16971(-)
MFLSTSASSLAFLLRVQIESTNLLQMVRFECLRVSSNLNEGTLDKLRASSSSVATNLSGGVTVFLGAWSIKLSSSTSYAYVVAGAASAIKSIKMIRNAVKAIGIGKSINNRNGTFSGIRWQIV